MSNPNPSAARQAKKRKAQLQTGTLADAQAVLWRALVRAGELLDNEDPALSLKAVHAVSQCAGSYARVLEVGELEARLLALEGAGEDAPGPRLSGRGAA